MIAARDSKLVVDAFEIADKASRFCGPDCGGCAGLMRSKRSGINEHLIQMPDQRLIALHNLKSQTARLCPTKADMLGQMVPHRLRLCHRSASERS